jgi:hypothetical protein
MSSGVLYPFQRRWVDDDSRFKIGMFARQTGKTFSTTLEIAEDILAHDVLGKRTRWVILSRGERQAKEAMDEGLKLHLRAMGSVFESIECDSGYLYEDGCSASKPGGGLMHRVQGDGIACQPGHGARVFGECVP